MAVPTGLWLSVPLNNPLSARPFLTVEDLDGQPVVTAGELNHLHRYLKSVCKRAGVEPWIPTTTSSALEMVSLARSYNGIVFSFPPGMMPAEHREHAAILQLRTPEADGFGTYVARRRDTPLSDAAQRFWDSL